MLQPIYFCGILCRSVPGIPSAKKILQCYFSLGSEPSLVTRLCEMSVSFNVISNVILSVVKFKYVATSSALRYPVHQSYNQQS